MRYSKQYNDFYSKFDFLMNLASVGVIKNIESLKKGILCAYEDVELSCKDGIMPDDVEGDGEMQCKTLSLSYEVEDPEDFTMWIKDYYRDWKLSIDMISREFGEELAKLRTLKNEILGLKMKEDEDGNVSSLDRLRIYIKTIPYEFLLMKNFHYHISITLFLLYHCTISKIKMVSPNCHPL